MAGLRWESARAVCCRAWAVTPPEFDRLVEAGELSIHDIIAQVDLEIMGNPSLVEYTHPGFLARLKQKRRDQANATAFEAMWRMTQKNQKGARK